MTTQTIKQCISPAQVFESLGKGLKMDFAEAGTNDWSHIDNAARISISDIYSGFLEFRYTPGFENNWERKQKESSKKYLAEFIGYDGSNNERYRVGIKSNFYYTLIKIKDDPHAKCGLKGFETYVESNGTLRFVDKATLKDWIIEAIEKARNFKNNKEHSKALEEVGHFSSPEYRDWKKTAPRSRGV